jgi:radical SAM protein with 4Fe4S-binding SPASM domain
MRGIRTRSLGYGAGLFTLVAMGWILTGRAASPRQAGLPPDWSHRHVIFSQPSTDAQAAAVMHDPRYWQQWNREHFVKALNAADVGLSNRSLFASAGASHADWSQNLGSGANAGAGREVFRDQALVGDVEEFCTIAAPADENALSALPCSAGHTACYVSPYGDVFPCVQFPLPTGNVRKERFVDIWRHSERMNEVRSIRLKDLTTCTSCSHVGSCTRCPGLAFMEGNMRGPSSQDCEKSFARTGIPSANMLAKKRASGDLVQIRIMPSNSAQPTVAIA